MALSLGSAAAQRAHSAGDVQWRIDLTRSPDRVVERARDVVRRNVLGLSVVGGAVWLYDIVQIVGR